MHFTYAESLDKQQLQQGDVLLRTPAIDSLLKNVHPYFHDRPDNLYFMVLTQTCDLVRRPSPKAEYIAICPVRPIQTVIERALKRFVSVSQAKIPVGSAKDRQKFQDFLTRLLNNNEPGYFYLYKDDLLQQDCCAITRLSISIRTEEHYDTCLSAKYIELNESFRAKLGWAVGNIYGRVGTEDWDSAELRKRIGEHMSSAIVWVADEKQRDSMVAQLDQLSAAGQDVNEASVAAVQRAFVPKKDQLVQLVQGLMEAAGVDEAKRKVVERRLRSDPQLTQLVKV